MSKTKDEQFIISLHLAEVEIGEDSIFDRYEIGRRAGLNPKAVDAISKLLIRSNFIKKAGEDGIVMTLRGRELSLRLLEEC
jgi:hypothetical protein